MFLKFTSQAQRRARGGSNFIEIQYCDLPADTAVHTIVAVNTIGHWSLSSLYVADEAAFCDAYRDILGKGLYSGLRYGPLDLQGINYYDAATTEKLLHQLQRTQPEDYWTFVQWLQNAKNGFYILGI